MTNRRSSLGSPFSAYYDPPTQAIYEKKRSEEQAKNSLFELSNQLFNELERQQSILDKETESISVSPQFKRRFSKCSSKKSQRGVPKTQQTSPDRNSPNKFNQTLQLRRTCTTGIDNGYRKKLLDIVQSMNVTEMQPMSCFNYNHYMVIDKRPPKLQKQINSQKNKSYRSYSIKRSRGLINKSKDKKLLLLQNVLIFKGNRIPNKQSSKRQYYGFQRSVRF